MCLCMALPMQNPTSGNSSTVHGLDCISQKTPVCGSLDAKLQKQESSDIYTISSFPADSRMGHATDQDEVVIVAAAADERRRRTGGSELTTSSSVFNKYRYAAHLLVVLFGISAWVSVNGIWVELPILVQKLPEGWNLPSYLTVVIQLANLGPIAYGLLHHYFPRRVNETSATFVMMTVGTLACFALIFVWNRTTSFGGDDDDKNVKRHSIHFLVLVYFVSLVDCTSSVVFLPFMAFFKEKYVVSLFIGEGLSGLLPGIVAIAQGINSDPNCVNVTLNVTMPESPIPNFGVEPFFGLITAMMAISFMAFILLRYLPSLESERSSKAYPKVSTTGYLANSASGRMEHAIIYSGRRFSSYGTDGIVHHEQPEVAIIPHTSKRISTTMFACILMVQAWICLVSNGVLSSISSYYCLPYGNSAYHYAVTLSSIVNPIASFAAAFIAVRNAFGLAMLALLGSVFAGYLFILALLSPTPPLVGTLIGQVIVVAVSISYSAIFSFVKVSFASLFRINGKIRALFWYGVATQIGSAIGSFVMFIMVNYMHVFHSVRPCA